MKTILLTICGALLILSSTAQQQPLNLWYKTPAKTWNDALPIGNGRLGAMVYGRVESEIIQLNEESLWAGKPVDDNNPNSKAHLAEIQRLLLAGDNNKAHALANQYMLATPPNFGSYQTLGNLRLDFNTDDKPVNYQRSLDIKRGITTVKYTTNKVDYQREIFVSAPDDAIVIRLTASKPKSISFKLNLHREYDASVVAVNNTSLLLNGQIIEVPSKDTGTGGLEMKFNALVKVITPDGNTQSANNSILIQDASEVTILVTAATDYNFSKLNFDRSIDAKAKCEDIIGKAANKSYPDLLNRHLDEFEPLMNKLSINLGNGNAYTLPTDERMAKIRKGETDQQLVALFFQYGRYLLLSSSRRPGQLPANLQGIWNEHYNAPWKSDYHTNINVQMNYWPVDIANVSTAMTPFVDFVDAYRVPGRIAAQEMYGAKGWTMHHATNIFGRTGIISGIHWGTSPMAASWLCLNVWEHYRFTGDQQFLKNKAYPILKEAVQFVQDFLVTDKHGYLVTAPSMSPENSFRLPNGQIDQLTYAPTIDVMIIMELYKACIEAAELLKEDKKFIASLQETLKKLPPIKISPRTGGIQEWIEDYEEVEPGHRHISHLLGLYPANLIHPTDTKLFEAARQTLALRLKNGGGHTGWSRAWIINFYARLLDGERAGENVQLLLQKSTFDNLFDNHPPFQIDGNFGGTAGIAEMLVQSHNGYIELLPALPKTWKIGEVSGLLARYGFEISMKWDEGKLTEARLTSKNGGRCKVKYKDKIITLNTGAGQQLSLVKLLQL